MVDLSSVSGWLRAFVAYERPSHARRQRRAGHHLGCDSVSAAFDEVETEQHPAGWHLLLQVLQRRVVGVGVAR